jgi:spore photoproduct lyase
MIRVIYIERAVADHPRTLEIQGRFPDATRIYCERYTEIFNRKAQNFRLQKKRQALILAGKFRQRLLPVPGGYGLGASPAYYFSHMLNCLYDCRYCFLQGMFRSAHYVLFVNYEDFATDIEQTLRLHETGSVQFFSGYDCDSLALEPVTRFTEFFLPLLAQHPRALLELRTKSTQIRTLLAHGPVPNCVVAFSFTPQPVATALEHKTPSIERRIEAMVRLQQQGWQIGLRFDPIIHETDYRENYARLFHDIFTVIDPDALHSVTLGSFRLPDDYFSTMLKLYPDEPLFASALGNTTGTTAGRKDMTICRSDIESEMLDYCNNLLSTFVPRGKIHYCHTTLA